MDEALEQQLQEAARTVRGCEAAARRASELGATLDRLRAERDARQSELADEERDVARLEGLSLSRVRSMFRGDREQDLEQERAEVEAARYRLAEAQSLLDAAQDEHDAAAAVATDLTDARAVLERVLADKERVLRGSRDPRGDRLFAIAQEVGRLRADQVETREAFDAAGTALRALDHVLDRLGSASSWSTYDTFFGGGLVSSAIKHSRLDEAAAASRQADRALLVLRRELADVGQVAPAGFAPVQGLTRFADLWLDNIFTDLAVRQRIRSSQDGTRRTRRQVGALQHALLQRREELTARERALLAERQDLLTAR